MLSAQKPATGRFSLLLLDENEYYIRDYVATCVWPADVQGNWQSSRQGVPGQIRLCSKSVFFDADDMRIPIVRIPFDSLEGLEGIGRAGIAATAQRWSFMRANAEDTPYLFHKSPPTCWQFTLMYAGLSEFMPLAQRMVIASRMPPVDQNALLVSTLEEMQAGIRFDLGHLRNPSMEVVLLELPAMQVLPLVKEPGRFVVTSSRIYMQPLHAVSGDSPVRSHPLAGVAAVARRRSGLKDVGLEVFFVAPSPTSGITGPVWGTVSAFFGFSSTADRETVVEVLSRQSCLGSALQGGNDVAAACGAVLEAGAAWLPRVTAAWQRGKLTNFDYLLYCNLAAGRSFNDLTQYPVFPWVLTDYKSSQLDLKDPAIFRDLSHPVGALNLPRLASFRERYREMAAHNSGDPPFMYGTHYSCPGYTLFWLVRAAPALMLRLQNGRFDAPDRLFCSISESWESVLRNPADVKELIPEFFDPSSAAFLVNSKRLALGTRQDGRVVGDVELPPWAQGSHQRFLRAHRAALEAPFVSANLHHWLDLIFGCKQRGKAAVAAYNVFRHITYEGSVDPDSIADPIQRVATEMAINEFGQCPRQIFIQPHPQRLVCPDPLPIDSVNPLSPTKADVGTPTTAESLSLVLVKTIMAVAVEEDAAPLPVHVPSFLRELDLGAGRSDADGDDEPQESGQHEGASVAMEEVSSPTKSDIDDRKNRRLFDLGKLRLEGSMERLRQGLNAATGTPKTNSKGGAFNARGVDKTSSESFLNTSVGPNTSIPEKALPRGMLSSLGTNLSSRWQSFRSSSTPTKQLATASPEESLKSETGANDVEIVVATHGCDVSKTASNIACWGPGLRDRLQQGVTLTAGNEGVNAVALTSMEGSRVVYAVDHDASIRVFNAESGEQLRNAHLGSQPLTSIALVHGDSSGSMALCGSYDGSVRVYSPSAGAALGNFAAHADAVSCVAIAGDGSLLATASWDCSLKVWSLAEGRYPWQSTLPQPVTAVAEIPGGVWSLSLSADGRGAVVGTEDGMLAFVDWRQGAGKVGWRVSVSEDYIGGVSLVSAGPSGSPEHVVAAAADGTLTLIDCRKAGEMVSSVACGSPLRCCVTDGALVLAGAESGALMFWDLGQQLSLPLWSGNTEYEINPPGIDGLYRSLESEPASAVNALAVDTHGAVCVASGHEGGVVKVWWAGVDATNR